MARSGGASPAALNIGRYWNVPNVGDEGGAEIVDAIMRKVVTVFSGCHRAGKAQ